MVIRRFPRHTVVPADDAALCDNPHTDTGTEGDKHQRVAAFAMPIVVFPNAARLTSFSNTTGHDCPSGRENRLGKRAGRRRLGESCTLRCLSIEPGIPIATCFKRFGVICACCSNACASDDICCSAACSSPLAVGCDVCANISPLNVVSRPLTLCRPDQNQSPQATAGAIQYPVISAG